MSKVKRVPTPLTRQNAMIPLSYLADKEIQRVIKKAQEELKNVKSKY